MKTRLLFYFVLFTFGFTLLSKYIFAQAPNISYTPSTNVYTPGTAIPALSPTNSGGAVAAVAFGTGASLTGAALSNPYGMGIDPSGNIYVTNYGNNTVSVYNSSGTYLNTFGTTAIANPQGITFDQSGNAYILNYNRTNNGLGNYHGNAYISQYNSSGVYGSTIIQGMGTANGIALDAANLYVAQGSYNNGSNTVSEFNTSGALSFSLNSAYIANPVGVAVDGSGNIYVLDNTNNNVSKFNSSGIYQSTIITGLSNALGISINGAGDVYTGDTGTNSVNVYNTAGTLLTSIAGLTDPEGLVTDSKGNLYVSDYTDGTVTKYPPLGGYYLSAPLPPGLSFSSTTGIFTGTPTTPFAATTYTITAYNASGNNSTTVTLSCPPNLSVPAISYNPPINVFTIGTAISLSPIHTGGTPTGYSISATLPAGLSFSTSTGIISGTPSIKSTATIYTITASNGSGSSSTVVSIACVVDNYWTGSKSSDWNTKQNWSANRVPVVTDLASIGVVNYTGAEPAILTNTSVPAYYVTFGANAGTLTVQTGAIFTINNILTINNNATPNFIGQGTGAINLVPAAVVNITGAGTLTITNSSSIVNLVTLQSNAAGSATVSQITTGSIIGKVNVQRYFQGSSTYLGGRYVERGYRIISSPVNIGTTVNGNNVYGLNYIVGNTAGQTTLANSTTNSFITGCTGGSTPAGNPSIYLYREDLAPSNASFTSGNYIGITNITNSTTLGTIGASDGGTYSIPVGNGVFFFFRGNATNWTTKTAYPLIAPENVTLTSTGTLNQGNITVNDWFTPAAGLSGIGTRYSMVGNPYPSSIDWETSTYGSSPGGIITSNIDASIYEFNPVNQQFEAYSASLHLGVGKASRIIVSGQGFFVHASNSGSSTLQFTETAKSAASQNTGVNLLMGKPAGQATAQQILRLKLITDTLNYSDIIIGFNSAASANYNGKEDAKYLPGSGAAEGLSSLSNDNIRLSINVLPLQKQTIKLNVTAIKSGQYSFERTALNNIPKIYEVWLMDHYKKDSLDFRANPTYNFNIDLKDTNSYRSNRFKLVIRQNRALGIHLLNFTATKASNGVQVIWKTENEQNYTNFTVERSNDEGKTFAVVGGYASDEGGNYSILDKVPPIGIYKYRLKIEDLNGTITYSNIITLIYTNPGNHGIFINNVSVYPNPTSGKINLTINQTSDKPLFKIIIVNNTGALIKESTSMIPSWQTDVSQLNPGTYFIQVLNKTDNSLVGKTAFVKL
ncbi:putative Ig domain-containing protein [Mucilaginibacter sp.]|uniref:putative Ig domain-containing protein n=1 Tax=Mucilaginibacter sp. TaxID=1882438 RepID=UPI00262C9FEB|nr:putative Ig domain-containing protein [Mucilaginibacter sp.]MDB4919057.1 hypothetical protein [Mucilaginibacter sp.]